MWGMSYSSWEFGGGLSHKFWYGKSAMHQRKKSSFVILAHKQNNGVFWKGYPRLRISMSLSYV